MRLLAPDQALQEGCARGEGELAQVPLEAIVAHSCEGLATVRTFLDARQSGIFTGMNPLLLPNTLWHEPSSAAGCTVSCLLWLGIKNGTTRRAAEVLQQGVAVAGVCSAAAAHFSCEVSGCCMQVF